MTWFGWIGVLAALVIASWVIVNEYGPIAFPSLIILWIAAVVLVSVLPGYFAGHAPVGEPLGRAQPQAAQPATPPPK